MEHEVKSDCFGYRNTLKGEGCIALNKLYCKHEECKFYKHLAECQKNPLSINYKGEADKED